MKEDFLHHIWQHKLFDSLRLKTIDDKSVQIKRVGDKNLNSGPDFFNAQLIIDNQLWAGNVEIHLKSSDWYLHNHEKDQNYDNVILHVVWEYDMPIFRKDNTEIPTLLLRSFIEEDLLSNYQHLFSKQQRWINCENDIYKIDKFLLSNWMERLYFERLEQKSDFILELLKDSNNDWEAVLFKLLVKNFGLKVNGSSFFEIASKLDFSSFRKEFANVLRLEALLFGQAGLLIEKKEGVYYNNLKKEYNYLSKKYDLIKPDRLSVDFFRLRPNNFPTIRLAQLASLYNRNQNLFSKLNEVSDMDGFYTIFNIKTSSFWDTHYNFDSQSKKRSKHLTKSFIDLLLINTIIPLQFVYQKHLGKVNEEYILWIIENIKPEKNTIIKKFISLNIKPKSAFESQALLHLKINYCSKQACLTCNLGSHLLNN